MTDQESRKLKRIQGFPSRIVLDTQGYVQVLSDARDF